MPKKAVTIVRLLPEASKVANARAVDKLQRDTKVFTAKKGLKLTQIVETVLKEYIKEEPEKESTKFRKPYCCW